MEKESPSSFFVNDGSFMERFKQLQQENVKGVTSEDPNQESSATVASGFKPVSMSIGSKNKANTGVRANTISGGKLAFSLKQKSKIVTPSVKLCEDEEEEENGSGNSLVDGAAKRQKLGCPEAPNDSSVQPDVAPASPSDPTVKKVADKLASFVAKNGRNFEHVTRQRNPGDTPFKFLFDESCADFKYYEYRLQVEEKLLGKKKELEASRTGTASNSVSRGLHSSMKHQPSNYHTPASALYEGNSTNSHHSGAEKSGDSGAPSGADPIAMMEYYAKKAAQEERKRPFKQSHDEMPPPASLQAAPGKKGHHMGDYIPLEELEKFMANCNDASAQKAAKEAAERAKIQADNVGHKLLSKMGWKEGEGLGSSRKGIADPIMAGDVKQNNLGVGAHNPGEVLPEDDIYEQYKKRMMLGYRHRPNPLNNPRKAYY